MPEGLLIRPDSYHDSVTLMAIARQVAGLPGVSNCVAVMGTAANREILHNAGLLSAEAAAAGPSDLIIAAAAESQASLAAALAAVAERLQRRPAAVSPGGGAAAPRSIPAALQATPAANIALVSVPGAHAAREARIALEQGLHVMLYSDHVPVAEEVALKRLAGEKGLLLMGPDCGTAILDGAGLGFANAVRRGPVGIVAASGTGAQELSTLVDRLGSGVSQLIGTGGRDLSEAVGGRMTLAAIERLQADEQTQVIVVIAKPPAAAVAAQVAARLQAGDKPHVLCLLGSGGPGIDAAAVQAVALATGQPAAALAARLGEDEPPPPPPPPVAPGRRWVRGLFTGGTLCHQALFLLEAALGPVICNVHPNPARRGGARQSSGHTLVDLGDDEFTSGRPHPMIDPSLRHQRLLVEAADPEVAVILLDVVTGYGSHADPAGALATAIAAAVQAGIVVIAAVTGSEADRQRRSDQIARLRAAGARVASTARRAAELAASTALGR